MDEQETSRRERGGSRHPVAPRDPRDRRCCGGTSAPRATAQGRAAARTRIADGGDRSRRHPRRSEGRRDARADRRDRARARHRPRRSSTTSGEAARPSSTARTSTRRSERRDPRGAREARPRSRSRSPTRSCTLSPDGEDARALRRPTPTAPGLPERPAVSEAVAHAPDRHARGVEARRRQRRDRRGARHRRRLRELQASSTSCPTSRASTFVDPYNFVGNNKHANDDHGHGSHVTGTIAQATNNGIGVAGVARNVKIMPLKVLSALGLGLGRRHRRRDPLRRRPRREGHQHVARRRVPVARAEEGRRVRARQGRHRRVRRRQREPRQGRLSGRVPRRDRRRRRRRTTRRSRSTRTTARTSTSRRRAATRATTRATATTPTAASCRTRS